MAFFCQGLFLLSFLPSALGILPERTDDLQDTLARLHLAPPTEGNGMVNLTQLHDKIPETFWGFLQKEDKQHPHYHAGTKEQHAQQQARATLEMLQLFSPCALCGHYKRYGSAHAGGYVMCEDVMQGTKAAYSFGTASNDDWATAITQNYGVPVYQFDCHHTEGTSCPAGKPCNLHFVPECLGMAQNDSHVFRSLEEHLQRHKPSGLPAEPMLRGGDFLLKVDVEGNEWNAFMDARLHVLRRMRQIVVEFHSVSHVEFHETFAETLRHMQKAGFIVAHIHGNNYGPMALFGNGRFKLADRLEVTFVNKLALPAAVDRTCRTTQYRLAEDAVDNPYNFDLPIPELPTEQDIITPSRIRVLRCHWWLTCSTYALALRIGPFVLLTGFMTTLILGLALMASEPSAKRTGEAWSFTKRTGAFYTRCQHV